MRVGAAAASASMYRTMPAWLVTLSPGSYPSTWRTVGIFESYDAPGQNSNLGCAAPGSAASKTTTPRKKRTITMMISAGCRRTVKSIFRTMKSCSFLLALPALARLRAPTLPPAWTRPR